MLRREVHIAAGSGPRIVTGVELRSSSAGLWDTDAATASWSLGVAAGLDDALLNAASGAVSWLIRASSEALDRTPWRSDDQRCLMRFTNAGSCMSRLTQSFATGERVCWYCQPDVELLLKYPPTPNVRSLSQIGPANIFALRSLYR